jgi:pimeloyl-ACP methyl ester carboxylesterase
VPSTKTTEVWHSQQLELARLSSAGKLITAEGSGHMIHLERPDLVAQAIREVIREARLGK